MIYLENIMIKLQHLDRRISFITLSSAGAVPEQYLSTLAGTYQTTPKAPHPIGFSVSSECNCRWKYGTSAAAGATTDEAC